MKLYARGGEGLGRQSGVVTAEEGPRELSLSKAWREARELIHRHRNRLAVGMLLMLVSRLAGLVLPACSKYFIDHVVVARQ
ncbi:MAG TPA: hypothetical protein VFB61_07335, partial [Gemmatimonadales bacterium]|nr:hypothetical protein [Gemmatimonadales bacterium]